MQCIKKNLYNGINRKFILKNKNKNAQKIKAFYILYHNVVIQKGMVIKWKEKIKFKN